MRELLQRLWRASKAGSVLAIGHFVILSVILIGISTNPGIDWPWWIAAPFTLDLPFSFMVQGLTYVIREAVVALPHGAFEGWLLSRREPFGSLDLFWLPAILYLSLGTIWQYFWPFLLEIDKRFQSNGDA
jgi:hypothetical protein